MMRGTLWMLAVFWPAPLAQPHPHPSAAADCAELRDLAVATIDATSAGRSAEAIAAARELGAALAGRTEPCPGLEVAPAYLHLTLARFARWDELLQLSPPPALPDSPTSATDHTRAGALTSYANGVALAATGRWEEARLTLRTLRETAYEGSGVRDPVIQIAVHALGGELSLRHGQPGDAAVLFQRAVRLQDALPATKPPGWHYPLRLSLGEALLAAGRAREAEVAYRESLTRDPEDGWSLHGLARALQAQGLIDEAAAVRKRFETAWRGADVELSVERY